MSKKRFTKNCSALEMSFIEDGLEEAFSAVQQRVDNSAAETESIQKTQLVLCIMIRGKITNRMVDIWAQELGGRSSQKLERNATQSIIDLNYWDNSEIVLNKYYTPNADVIVIDSDTLPYSAENVKKFLKWCNCRLYSSLKQVLNAKDGYETKILNEKWMIDVVNCVRSNNLKVNSTAVHTGCNATAYNFNKLSIIKQSLANHTLMSELGTQLKTSNTACDASTMEWINEYLHPLFANAQEELFGAGECCSMHSSSLNKISSGNRNTTRNCLKNALADDITGNVDVGFEKVNVPIETAKFACATAGTLRMKSKNENKHITDILEPLQEMYSLKANEQYRAVSYKRCIDLLKKREKITDVVQLQGIKGIGKSLLDKIQEVLETGALQKLDNFQTDPKVTALLELTLIWGVGSTKAEELFKKGFRSIADLRNFHGLNGFTSGNDRDKSIENMDATANNVEEDASPLVGILNRQQRIGLKYYEELLTRIPRTEVTALGEVVAQHVEALCPGSEFIIGGSYRRGAADCGDIDCIIYPPRETSFSGACAPKGKCLDLRDLVISLSEAGFLTDHLTLPHNFYANKSDSPKKKKQKGNEDAISSNDVVAGMHASYMGICVLHPEGSGKTSTHRRIDIKTYPRSAYACSLLYFTGNDHFNRSMRLYASKKGYSLGNDGLYKCVRDNQRNKIVSQTDAVPCKTEKEVFEFLGLPYKEPWERHCF